VRNRLEFWGPVFAVSEKFLFCSLYSGEFFGYTMHTEQMFEGERLTGFNPKDDLVIDLVRFFSVIWKREESGTQ